MVITRYKSVRIIILILLVLLIPFTLIDVFLWDNYYWRKGLGFHPEVETYKDYFGGTGVATLKVSVGTRPGIVLIEEFLHGELDVRIFTYQFELNSSGLVNAIRLINTTARVYQGATYMGSFLTECDGLVCTFSNTYPVNSLWTFFITGSVRAEIEVQGNSQIVPYYYSISYTVPELSWDEAYIFPLIIIGQVSVIIALIAAIIIIRRARRPIPPPPYVLRSEKDA